MHVLSFSGDTFFSLSPTFARRWNIPLATFLNMNFALHYIKFVRSHGINIIMDARFNLDGRAERMPGGNDRNILHFRDSGAAEAESFMKTLHFFD